GGNSVTVKALYTTFTGPVTVSAYSPGGNGGQIAIIANRGYSFVIGSATTPTGSNGTTGTLSATGVNGGSISVTNLGGNSTVASGIFLNDPTKLTVTAAPASAFANGGDGGSIYL